MSDIVLADDRKTELAERFLQSTDVSVSRLDGRWREQAVAVSADPFDVWISFTNEDVAWAQIPFQLPPVVIQGTTTSGWAFGAGRHVPRKEDCTLCRMPRPEAQFRGPCAEGEIGQIEAKPSVPASLPFHSTAAAALVLAELFKLDLADPIQFPNQVSADLKTGLPTVIVARRLADHNCRGCKAVQLSLWNARGGRGRHKKLSL